MKLYIVATPIGNLKDITLRALEVLKSVDIIIAEDTRVSKKLLSHYDIHKPLMSYHEHSSRNDIARIIDILESGKNIAYIVDAGTPGISDPGRFLVEHVSAHARISIIPIPGPSALTAALSVAGLRSDKFLFLGFPPPKKGRKKFFQEISQLAEEVKYPIVLYESPHRLLKTLKELSDIGLSMFDAILIKEISKVYEAILRMRIVDLIKKISEEKRVKGEFVLIINK